jgi:hypothetical protein
MKEFYLFIDLGFQFFGISIFLGIGIGIIIGLAKLTYEKIVL